jgi:S-adenosylmethionine synthetase
VADQISDAILDAFLEKDPHARVACETMLADSHVIVAGEFKSSSDTLFQEIRDRAETMVREKIRSIGYGDAAYDIDPDTCDVKISFNHQSADISIGVDRADGETGAGDQGLMFGYACDETPQKMPLPIDLAHRLMRRHAEVRRSGSLPWLRPDAKSQVTVRYEGFRPVGIDTVVLSTQHDRSVTTEELRQAVTSEIIDPLVPASMRLPEFRVLINPTGRFEVGGPKGDTGLTGRKIIVDTYGGSCAHGGGAFSGKDPSKVDRSAAYMARYIARNIVAAGLARRCNIQLAYAIGVTEPVSVLVDTQRTGTVADDVLERLVRKVFSLTPSGIIRSLDLLRPRYAPIAAYGHFGRDDLDLPWEREDKVEELLGALEGIIQPVQAV